MRTTPETRLGDGSGELVSASGQGDVVEDAVTGVSNADKRNIGRTAAEAVQVPGFFIPDEPEDRPAALDAIETAMGKIIKNSQPNEARQSVPDDTLDLYFDELGKVPLLTADEEVVLAQIIKTGNAAAVKLESTGTEDTLLSQFVEYGQKAQDHFAAANLRLVVSVAKQFTKRSRLEFGELIQEGNLGLLRAVEKFDWRRGYKFSTYATWWIRQSIQRGVADSERTIRLPIALHDALVKVRAAGARLELETGCEATIPELAEATRLSEDKVRRAMESDHVVTSLDQSVGFDSGASDLGEFVAVAEDSPADEVVERSFIEGILDLAREKLDERALYVMTRRYGLDGQQPLTLDALGRELGLSRESIRKIESGALHRLQEMLGVSVDQEVA